MAKRDQFFEADEFFRGCLKVIEGWEKHFEKEKFLYLKELVYTKNRIKDGTIPVEALNGKTIEESKQELIDYYESEIRTIDDSFVAQQPTMPLSLLTNGRVNHITYDEVMQIKDSINKAYQKTLIEEKIHPFIEWLLPQKPTPETQVISKGLTDKPNDNTDQIKAIIAAMFPLANDNERQSLLNHLNGQTGYLKLTYIGKKTDLWNHLKIIRQSGIDRNVLATVFSECCQWKKTTTAQSTELKYKEIHTKI